MANNLSSALCHFFISGCCCCGAVGCDDIGCVVAVVGVVAGRLLLLVSGVEDIPVGGVLVDVALPMAFVLVCLSEQKQGETDMLIVDGTWIN